MEISSGETTSSDFFHPSSFVEECTRMLFCKTPAGSNPGEYHHHHLHPLLLLHAYGSLSKKWGENLEIQLSKKSEN